MTLPAATAERLNPRWARLDRLRQVMAREGVDALVVENRHNLRYLSGFTGSSGWLVVGREVAVLITDFRYQEQAAAEAAGLRVVVYPGQKSIETIDGLLTELHAERVGFEARQVSVARFRQYERLLARPGRWLVPTEDLVEGLRAVKEPEELGFVAGAMAITEAALEAVLGLVRPGVTELDLAVELEYRMRRGGADALAFEVIVASGPRSALPHARPSRRPLATGDLVLFDLGAVSQGYAADLTRTVVLGQPTVEQRRIYATVLEAAQAAREQLRPGQTCAEVDQAARQVIETAGYGEQFGHGLGHGVGLFVHEGPRLAPGETGRLENGMVVTVEPGIYVPGWGGVRIEDLVAVADDEPRVFTRMSRELMVL